VDDRPNHQSGFDEDDDDYGLCVLLQSVGLKHDARATMKIHFPDLHPGLPRMKGVAGCGGGGPPTNNSSKSLYREIKIPKVSDFVAEDMIGFCSVVDTISILADGFCDLDLSISGVFSLDYSRVRWVVPLEGAPSHWPAGPPGPRIAGSGQQPSSPAPGTGPGVQRRPLL